MYVLVTDTPVLIHSTSDDEIGSDFNNHESEVTFTEFVPVSSKL